MNTIEFHDYYWFALWSKLPINAKNLYQILSDNQILNFKLRLFNYYFYNLKFTTMNDEIFIFEKGLPNGKNLNLIPKNSNRLKFYTENLKLFEFPIHSIYQTETHTVLYSIPDARTIVQAYNNDPIIADEKLNKLCPQKILKNEIKDHAYFLVSRHGE